MIREIRVALALFALVGSATRAVDATPPPTAPTTVALLGGQRPTQSLIGLRYRGVAHFPARSRSLAAPRFNGLEVQKDDNEREVEDLKPAMRTAPNVAAIATPAPAGLGVVKPDSIFSGFAGITHFDQRNAGTGIYSNSQFSLEPPDQALCVGNGFVFEAVNNALAVYSSGGLPLVGPVALSQFWGLAPEIIRPPGGTPGPYGQFISDPKCYYDTQTKRFFVTELEIDTNPATGADANHSSVLLGVSQTADPTGAFNLYSFDTTDGTSPGCPCFGDQPLLGADANGIFVTTNEFTIAPGGFNGAQIYALSKKALVGATSTPIVHIDAGTIVTPDSGGIWYSIQPATSPATSQYSSALGGTEYFLSALDFFNLGDNRIAVWALSNTSSLANALPSLSLRNDVLRSQAYSPPLPATQRPGYTPLATSLGASLERINTNDDRMNQVVFSHGHLWSGVNTAVSFGKTIDAGIAYFDVAPSVSTGKLTASLTSSGYVSVAGQNVFFPSIGVTASGIPIMTATLSGPNYFPSAVYTLLQPSGPLNLRLAGPGALPDDGFTAYKTYGGSGVARWGDYSAAVADGNGNMWFATEYIPSSFRTVLANWGTFIGHLKAQ